MSHTNGKWIYDPGDTGDDSVGIGPTSPYIVAELNDGKDAVPICTLDEPRRSRGEAPKDEYDDGTETIGDLDANARLICAAPDMLAVLKLVAEWSALHEIRPKKYIDAVEAVINLAEKGE